MGDALGAPVEFMSLPTIRAQFGQQGVVDLEGAHGRVGAITDDTQMTMFTAEGLIRARNRATDRGICSPVGGVFRAYQRWLWTQDPAEAAALMRYDWQLSGWLHNVPQLSSRRAPGTTCLGALRTGTMGTIESQINDSKGCGGVMRVAPVGLLPPRDAFDDGCEIAAITHGHPSGYLTAGLFAETVANLVEGHDLRRALDLALSRLPRWRNAVETRKAVRGAIALAESNAPSTPEVVERLGEGWVAEEALAIAVFCALRATRFEEGVLLAVNHGGDSDSTGSICGNLLGLTYGRSGIPARWLDRLELRPEIERVARDLLDEHASFDDYPPN